VAEVAAASACLALALDPRNSYALVGRAELAGKK
jgi:hypothetical protein